MVTCCMDMSVLQLLLSGFSHLNNFNIEKKCFASQRMVQVNRHFFAINFGNIGNTYAFVCLHTNLHSFNQFLISISLKA